MIIHYQPSRTVASLIYKNASTYVTLIWEYGNVLEGLQSSFPTIVILHFCILQINSIQLSPCSAFVSQFLDVAVMPYTAGIAHHTLYTTSMSLSFQEIGYAYMNK